MIKFKNNTYDMRHTVEISNTYAVQIERNSKEHGIQFVKVEIANEKEVFGFATLDAPFHMSEIYRKRNILKAIPGDKVILAGSKDNKAFTIERIFDLNAHASIPSDTIKYAQFTSGEMVPLRALEYF